MFNDYMWKTYLDAGGKDISEKFKINLTGAFSEEYADFIFDLHKNFCPSEFINNRLKDELLDVFAYKTNDIFIFEDGEYTIESGLRYFYNLLLGGEQLSEQKLFNYFSGSVAYYTTYLATELSELFVPYYF